MLRPVHSSVTPADIDPSGSADGDVLTSTGPGSPPDWEPPTGGGGAPILSPDTYPDTPLPADDEFDSVNFPLEVGLDTAGTRFTGALAWTWVNQGGAAAAVVNGHLVITAPNSAGTQYRMIFQPAPAAPWRRRLKISGIAGEGDQYIAAGIVVRNSGTGELLIHIAQNGQSWSAYQVYYTDPATYGGFANEGQPNTFTKAAAADVWSISFPIYLELENDGTDLIWRWSNSGAEGSYFEMGRDTIATHIGAIDQVGIAVNVENTKPGAFAFDWFRDAGP